MYNDIENCLVLFKRLLKRKTPNFKVCFLHQLVYVNLIFDTLFPISLLCSNNLKLNIFNRNRYKLFSCYSLDIIEGYVENMQNNSSALDRIILVDFRALNQMFTPASGLNETCRSFLC